jgi:hypothetical protein
MVVVLKGMMLLKTWKIVDTSRRVLLSCEKVVDELWSTEWP